MEARAALMFTSSTGKATAAVPGRANVERETSRRSESSNMGSPPGYVHFDIKKPLELPDPEGFQPITSDEHLISQRVKDEKRWDEEHQEAYRVANENAKQRLTSDTASLLKAAQTSATQISLAHENFSRHCRDQMTRSLESTASYAELQLQAASFAEFHSNAATSMAGTLASQVVEMSDQMHKARQLQVDIERCHGVLNELDILMDDLERMTEMEGGGMPAMAGEEGGIQ